ncbi:AsmA-like C-terminal domain-containing protein [Helicobacter sp. 13S00477-4]|uniref:YhdP family protein n=1 Tax=Helicobacter sp. 13S00477-4 TaxID=1905759 RepID=UPI000BA51377|nr:AsmA-like C-terminal domain-containing protein [Helicobacter sp. 13S00477-4]PAF51251.1 hypothetical protein BKH44_05965 [Helicobacter sp. 13S00477-4]
MSRIVSKKILSLVVFFVIVLILLSTGYKILSDGFHIQNLKIGKVDVSGLYLKLDNKLILDVDRLDVSSYFTNPSHGAFDIEQFTENIKYGIWAISYFQKFFIKNIILDNNNQASVMYDGKQYKIEFPNIQANFAIKDNNKDIHLKILNLIFKDIGIRTDGNIIYSTQSKKLGFDLILSSVEMKKDTLYLQGITNLKSLSLKAKTSTIKNIDYLKPYLEKIPNKEFKSWIFDKIQFSSFRLISASFLIDLNKNHFFSSIVKTANVKLEVEDPQVYLEDGLKPIIAKQVVVNAEKGRIFINMQDPFYDGIDLNGSNLVLSNLLDSPKLDIDIVSQKALYLKSIRDLLAAYEIDLPIDSISSPIDTNIKLSLQFLQNSDPIVNVKGVLHTQESDFSLYGIPLYSENTDVSLDITPQYKYVYIDSIHTKYENMSDMDVKVALNLMDKNLHIDTNIHRIKVSTNNDLNTKSLKNDSQTQIVSKERKEDESKTPHTQSDYQITPLSSQPSSVQTLKRKIIDSIKTQAKANFTKDIFYATGDTLSNFSINIDFSDPQKIAFDIPDFEVDGLIEGDLYSINLRDLGKFYPYSPIMNYLSLKEGNVSLDTNDFEKIDFKGNLFNLDTPFLYKKDGQAIRNISFSGKINKQGMELSALNGDIFLDVKGEQKNLTLKGLDFNLDEFIKSEIPAIKEVFDSDGEKQSYTQQQIIDETHFIREKQKYERLHNIEPVITTIQTDAIDITYKKHHILLDNTNLKLQDGRVAIDGTYKNGVVNVDIIHDNIYIRANNFSGDFVNQVLNKNIVKGGLYTLLGVYKDNVFNAQLKLQNTIFKDFALLQNLVNLIDTIPSLIVFKDPNLGVDGYKIEKGNIVFAINSKYIGFEHIDITGSSMDVNGNGIIELGTDDINMTLTISTIKNFSNIINKIPIVGYLILGNEGKISTNVIVNGTLEKPNTKITLAEDIIKAPINIFKRLFTPIDIIVDEIRNEMKKE